MTIGFTWAVTIAHSAARNLTRTSYTITTRAPIMANTPNKLKLFCRSEALFDFRDGLALALAIIDNIIIIFSGWTDISLILLHRTLVTLMTAAGIPIAARKSIDIGKVETEVISFIGKNIHLKTNTVVLMTSRVKKMVAFTKTYDLGKTSRLQCGHH